MADYGCNILLMAEYGCISAEYGFPAKCSHIQSYSANDQKGMA
jgi:hypothetical protein